MRSRVSELTVDDDEVTAVDRPGEIAPLQDDLHGRRPVDEVGEDDAAVVPHPAHPSGQPDRTRPVGVTARSDLSGRRGVLDPDRVGLDAGRPQ